MSRHEIQEQELKFIFGWDPPLQSFFLQVHDSTRAEDEQIVVWLGATRATRMTEVVELCEAARTAGLLITPSQRGMLQAEKDRGL